MGDSVESLAEVEVDNIHCSPLIYPASHIVIESFEVEGVIIELDIVCMTVQPNLLSNTRHYLTVS